MPGFSNTMACKNNYASILMNNKHNRPSVRSLLPSGGLSFFFHAASIIITGLQWFHQSRKGFRRPVGFDFLQEYVMIVFMNNQTESAGTYQESKQTEQAATSALVKLEHMAMAIVKRGIRAERIESESMEFSDEARSMTPEAFHFLYCALSINLTGRRLASDWGADAVCFSFQHACGEGSCILTRDGDSFRLHAGTKESLKRGLRRLSESEDSLIAGYEALNSMLGGM